MQSKKKADKAYYWIVTKNNEWQGFNPKRFSTYLIKQFYQF